VWPGEKVDVNGALKVGGMVTVLIQLDRIPAGGDGEALLTLMNFFDGYVQLHWIGRS
jgi:hypothetical protein